MHSSCRTSCAYHSPVLKRMKMSKRSLTGKEMKRVCSDIQCWQKVLNRLVGVAGLKGFCMRLLKETYPEKLSQSEVSRIRAKYYKISTKPCLVSFIFDDIMSFIYHLSIKRVNVLRNLTAQNFPAIETSCLLFGSFDFFSNYPFSSVSCCCQISTVQMQCGFNWLD